MPMLTELGFWACLALVIYVYAGYPAGVLLLAPILNRGVRKGDITPDVTVVISAFNEEGEIEGTVVNKLSQDFPPDRLDVIVVSDGSTDRTSEIVQGLAKRSQVGAQHWNIHPARLDAVGSYQRTTDVNVTP